MTPAREASAVEAEARLKKAIKFADNCELVWDPESDSAELPDAFVTSAVHAGIAAADAICIRRLGRYSASGSHVEAVTLLQSVDKSLANVLQRLLNVKTKAGYSPHPVSATDVVVARRAYLSLVGGAGSLRSSQLNCA